MSHDYATAIGAASAAADTAADVLATLRGHLKRAAEAADRGCSPDTAAAIDLMAKEAGEAGAAAVRLARETAMYADRAARAGR